jgi:hypothetical protein
VTHTLVRYAITLNALGLALWGFLPNIVYVSPIVTMEALDYMSHAVMPWVDEDVISWT